MAPIDVHALSGRWLAVALVLRAAGAQAYAGAHGNVTSPEAPAYGATMLHPEKAPLRTSGRYIVDRRGERVKWACTSWYGSYSTTHAVGGLEVRKMDDIVDRIVELGFNCVRLMYSTQGYAANPVIEDDVVAANPELKGMRFLDVFDRTVEAMTSKGLMVIINNHNSKSGWCCHYSQDEGLWYVPEYSEEDWIESLVGMTTRYRTNPMVVAIDLRNEPHDYQDTHLTWGGGDPKTDWAAAAVRAGNRVLEANPDVLIVVMAMCFGMDLRPLKKMPLQMSHPNRIVYQTHNYLEFQIMDNIAKMYAPWHFIRQCALPAAFGLICLASTLYYGWVRIGKPQPPRGMLTCSYFGWLLVGSLAASAYSYKLYLFGKQFCQLIVDTDLLPWIQLFVGMAVLSLAMFLNGLRCLVVDRFRKVRQEEESFGGNPSDAVAQAPTDLWVPGERRPGEVLPYPAAGAASEKADIEAASQSSLAEVECTCTGHKVGRFYSSSQMRAALFCDLERLSIRVLSWLNFAEAPRPWAAKEVEVPAQWDLGMSIMLQLGVVATLFLSMAMAIYIIAHLAPTYWWMERHLDEMWGFALQENHEYTAPVWMGEFGAGVRGQWWLNFVRYLSTRDVDFAYWALNGKKWAEGYITGTGQFVNYDQARWDDESYGILGQDYETVRHAWKMVDMMGLMASPSSWRPDAMPCSSSTDPACLN